MSSKYQGIDIETIINKNFERNRGEKKNENKKR